MRLKTRSDRFRAVAAALMISIAFAPAADAKSHRHYADQGGHYTGGHGSSHKGGHYKNARTRNHYTHHER